MTTVKLIMTVMLAIIAIWVFGMVMSVLTLKISDWLWSAI